MPRFWTLARTLTTVSAAAAFRRAAPLYFGIGIAAAVLFAGNGLDAATVVALAESSWPVRLGLWASWLVALTPLAHTLLEDPATRWLRSLPVPRSHFWLVCGVHLAAAELPWTVLWGRGGGWLAGAAATALAVAAHALVVARPRGAVEWLAAAFVATAIAVPAVQHEGEGKATQQLAMLVVGLWGARVGVAAAFGRAPEHDRRRARRTVGGPAPVALALAHLAMLRRGEGATLGRSAALTLLGSAVATLAIRSNGVTSLGGRLVVALAAMALPLALASAALARPLAAGERAADGFLAAHAAGPGLRALAAAGALASCGALLGLAHGALVALGAGADVGQAGVLALAGAAGAAALAVLVLAVTRAAERGSPRDAERVLVGVVATAIGALVAVVVLGAPALALWILAAAVALGIACRGSHRARAVPPGSPP